MKLVAAIAWGLALSAVDSGAVRAQGLKREADPEGTLVQELVVRARAPGPAWWRVSKGEATVWVLGVPAALPKDVGWNDVLLKSRLEGARALLLPPEVRVGPLKALVFFLKHRKALKSTAPLETSLPPPLAQRFAAARGGLGKPAKRYTDWRPAVAGVLLDQDFGRALGVQPNQPLDRIRADGRGARVPEERPGRYSPDAMLAEIANLSPEADRDCLTDALAEVEAGAGRVSAAAKGWAGGDVAAAVAAERGYERCLATLPAIAALLQQGQADTARAIAAALDRPGRTVAVVELRALLARGGVLERLRAQGFDVRSPGED